MLPWPGARVVHCRFPMVLPIIGRTLPAASPMTCRRGRALPATTNLSRTDSPLKARQSPGRQSAACRDSRNRKSETWRHGSSSDGFHRAAGPDIGCATAAGRRETAQRFRRRPGRFALERNPDKPALNPDRGAQAGLWTRSCSENTTASRHAGAQQIVEMHDADRPLRLDHDQRRDLRGIEQLAAPRRPIGRAAWSSAMSS